MTDRRAPTVLSRVLTSLRRRARFRGARAAVQVLGAAVGVGLFALAIRLALSPENRDQIEALMRAPAGLVALLVGLTLVSVTVNGLLFWIAALPLHRLRAIDVVGVNAIAMFLSVLPFKLNLLARIVIHHRRDGMALKDVVAWLAAVAALALAALGPLAAASLWRRSLDPWWWAACAGGIAALSGLGIVLGRLSARRPWLARLSFGSWRVVRRPGIVWVNQGIRLVDVGLLACRFLVVAAMLGVNVDAPGAVVLATLWFAVSVAAPAGTLGYREVILVVLSGRLGLPRETLATMALTVMVSEWLVSGAMSLAACAWLRPDRLVRGGGAGGAPPPDPRAG